MWCVFNDASRGFKAGASNTLSNNSVICQKFRKDTDTVESKCLRARQWNILLFCILFYFNTTISIRNLITDNNLRLREFQSFLVFGSSPFWFNVSIYFSWHRLHKFVQNLTIHFRSNPSACPLNGCFRLTDKIRGTADPLYKAVQ